MRHFYGLSDAHPLGHSRYSKPQKLHDSQELWTRFRKLALSLGFALPGGQLSRSTQQPPEFTAIHTLLTRLQPPELFKYDPSILAECSSHMTNVLTKMKEHRAEAPCPSLSLDIEENWSLQKRCGMTDIDTFFLDQKYLFFHNIYCHPNGPQLQSLTSFAVKRDMFLAFFPRFQEDIDMTEVHPIPHAGRRDPEPTIPQVGSLSMFQTVPVQNSTTSPEKDNVEMCDNLSQPQLPFDMDTQQRSQSQLHPTINPQFPETMSFTRPELGLIQQTSNRPLQGTLVSSSLTKYVSDPVESEIPFTCSYKISISPSLFYAKFAKQTQEGPPYFLFFRISEGEIICLLKSKVDDAFPSLLHRLGDVWFAIPDEKSGVLHTLTMQDIMSILHQDVRILFLGKPGDFNSNILVHGTAIEEHIPMPCFNAGQEIWETKLSGPDEEL